MADNNSNHPEGDSGGAPRRPKNYTGVVLVILIIAVCAMVLQNSLAEPTKITWPEFVDKLISGEIEKAELEKNVLSVSLRGNDDERAPTARVIVPSEFVIQNLNSIEKLAELGESRAELEIDPLKEHLLRVQAGTEKRGFQVFRRVLLTRKAGESAMVIEMTVPKALGNDDDEGVPGQHGVFLLAPGSFQQKDGSTAQLSWADLLEATAADQENAAGGLPAVSAVTENLPLSKGTVTFSEGEGLMTTLLVSLAPWVIMVLFFWFFIFRQMRGGGGVGGNVLSFGKSRAKVVNREKSGITFDDVAGIDEAQGEVGEIVEFLKDPTKFNQLGGRVPSGVLLVGPPGNGKTLLAKAIAGEADVPFYSICGSDFVEMFVGVGASRVRDLFKQAKENAPCIIFLDEIDAVGRRRGAGLGGGHDEREQTLNAILVEMDGFETDGGVIVVAATNRADVLDPALLRPGRFDRQIQIDLPDIRGREAILAVHSKRIVMHPSVDLEVIARGTPGFSGAELEALMNEAAIGAVMNGKEFVFEEDLEEARDRIRWGRSRTSRIMEEDDRRVTAYHEAGHTLVSLKNDKANKPHKVTIVPRGRALGATMMLPEKEQYSFSQKQAEAQLQVLFGGRLAEELTFDDITSGASDDIKRATELATHMVREWGMSKLVGPMCLVDHQETVFLGRDMGRQPSFAPSTLELIDNEVKRVVENAYTASRQILEAHNELLCLFAENLLEYETLTREEIAGLEAGETVESVREREAGRRRENASSLTSDAQPTQPNPTLPDTGPNLDTPPDFAGEGAMQVRDQGPPIA